MSAVPSSPLAAFDAVYNNGVTAASVAVRVVAAADGLVIVTPEGSPVDRWPVESIRLVDAGQDHARLANGETDMARLTVGSSAWRTLQDRYPHLLKRKGTSRKEIGRVAAWTAVAVAAVVVLFVWLIPALAVSVAGMIPPEFERQVGRNLADQVAAQLTLSRDAARTSCAANREGRAALDRIVGRLEQASGLDGLETRVVDAALPNAFALPGGQMIVTRGLLEMLEAPEELAGILAHEAGHVALRHPTETAIKIGGTSFLIGLLIGDVAGGGTVALAADILTRTGYSRAAEREADAYAIDLMDAAGIDPAALGAAFDRLAEHEVAIPAFLSTHPPTGTRAELARTRATGQASELLNADDWAALKAICGPK